MVGERHHQNFDDLTGLMKDLQEVGLIHPIVVTNDLTLVAGARRLEATKSLGATVIEVRRVGELTPQERTIIELEENLRRKKSDSNRTQSNCRLSSGGGRRATS